MSLDEKICYPKDIMPNFQMKLLPFDEVKQFIKELKHMIEFECTPLPNGKSISNRLNSQIDIIVGEGLI